LSKSGGREWFRRLAALFLPGGSLAQPLLFEWFGCKLMHE
jgi:hypothetical protein